MAKAKTQKKDNGSSLSNLMAQNAIDEENRKQIEEKALKNVPLISEFLAYPLGSLDDARKQIAFDLSQIKSKKKTETQKVQEVLPKFMDELQYHILSFNRIVFENHYADALDWNSALRNLDLNIQHLSRVKTEINACLMLLGKEVEYEAGESPTFNNQTGEWAVPVAVQIPDDKPYAEIDLDLIDFSETAPQKERRLDLEFEKSELIELAESIKTEGVLQPILVRRKGSRFECCAGERRVRASIIAGLKTIPTVIRLLTDEQVLKAQYHENIKRTNLTPLSEAYTYTYLEEKEGKSLEEIAAQTGKSVRYIAKRKLLVKLSDKIKNFLRRKLITTSHAEEIIRFTAGRLPSEQDEVLELAFNNFGYASQALYPVAKFIDNIETYFLLRLDYAPFSLTATNLAFNKSCLKCEFRTSAQPLLNEDYLDENDCCTNPACWNQKAAANEKITAAKKTANNKNNNVSESKPEISSPNNRLEHLENTKEITLKNQNDRFDREVFDAIRLRVATKAVVQVDGNVPGTNTLVFKRVVARMWQMQCRFDEEVTHRIAKTLGLNPDTFPCEAGEEFAEYLKAISELSDTLLRRVNFLLIFECYQTEEEIKTLCSEKGIDYQILDAEERLAQIPMNRKAEFRYYLHELESGNREAVKPKRYL